MFVLSSLVDDSVDQIIASMRLHAVYVMGWIAMEYYISMPFITQSACVPTGPTWTTQTESPVPGEKDKCKLICPHEENFLICMWYMTCL